MTPPLPDKCDACSKALAEPRVVCKRCKMYAYCDDACRQFDWKFQHYRGCSVLPAELVPAKVEPDQERDEEVNKIIGLLTMMIEDMQAYPGVPVPGEQDITAHQMTARSLLLFLAHRLPPSCTLPPIPGHPAAAPDSPKLKVRQIARLFLLHDLARLSRAEADALFLPLSPVGPPVEIDGLRANGPGTAPQAKLYGAKVLAVPEGLSMDEYAALTYFMTKVSSGKGEVSKWAALGVAAAAVYSAVLIGM